MAETTLTTPRGRFTVRRPGATSDSPLRAWSAADQLVLDHLGSDDLGRVLIVNDEFGALFCGLHDASPVLWTDSALSRGWTTRNAEASGIDAPAADQFVAGDEQPQGMFNTIIVRIPKSLALLEYQLAVVATVAAPGVRIVGAAMVRHMQSSTVAAFERLGPTTTSLAKRKARLIFCEPAHLPAAQVSALLPQQEFRTDAGVRVVEYPGTFSAGHLDVGSALLLATLADLPTPRSGATVLDLGCGNGVLITSAALRWKLDALSAVAIDVSDLAVAATKATWVANGLAERPDYMLDARASDGLPHAEERASERLAAHTCDLVISNPPFHQGHAVDAALTDRLLADAARVLAPKGCAIVVVQRHLQLHTRMRRWFGRVDVASKHPSHVVLVASKPR